MLYPPTFEQKLGFDKIRHLLNSYCKTSAGKTYCQKMRFSTDAALITRLTGQSYEMLNILRSGKNFPEDELQDLTQTCEKAAIEGSFLSEAEFAHLRRSIETGAAVVDMLVASREMAQELYALLPKFSLSPLKSAIDRVLDSLGKVKDNASPELAHLRKQIFARENEARKTIDSVLRHYKSQGYTKEDAQPTIRDGRYVIPIDSAYKRTAGGLVHDSSATGQTLFVEPQQLLELNNDVRELMLKEKAEVVKILSRLTDQIRPELGVVMQLNHFLGLTDFIRAKARLAQMLEAERPDFLEKPYIEWIEARHPLLQMSRKVVPLNLKLDDSTRILLISGPNAGGKSVALKTVALCQYMWQCGLLVPMKKNSQIGLFKHILLDIGDDQSLESDLSTYSSHLTAMKQFLRQASPDSLCLIDEFGTGTEPQLGAAIAESILEVLHGHGVFGVITTHYSNLKYFAERTQGIQNGAMKYDVQEMTPLFELEQGKPGSSFALEIAQKIGLPKAVVGKARQKVGQKQVSIEELLIRLSTEEKELNTQKQLLAEQTARYQELLSKYEKLSAELEENKKHILQKAKLEAKMLIEQANRQIENTIRAIKENKAEKEATKVARTQLQELKSQIEETIEESPEPSYEELKGEAISPGDWVKIEGQDAIGEVAALNGKDAQIIIGSLRTSVKLSRLVKVNRQDVRRQNRIVAESSGVGSNILEKKLEFSHELDLRGKRAEEVLGILDRFMDAALLAGEVQVRVLHGKGNGVLREVVRSHLKGYKQVRSMRDEHPDRGGSGITWVELA
jgi:DNA mismatch repair protein MutS2